MIESTRDHIMVSFCSLLELDMFKRVTRVKRKKKSEKEESKKGSKDSPKSSKNKVNFLIVNIHRLLIFITNMATIFNQINFYTQRKQVTSLKDPRGKK